MLRSWYSFLLRPFHNAGDLVEGNDVATVQLHFTLGKVIFSPKYPIWLDILIHQIQTNVIQYKELIQVIQLIKVHCVKIISCLPQSFLIKKK